MAEQRSAMSYAVVDAALTSVLAKHPDAVVAAIDDDGLFVPMPSTLDIGAHRVAHARSALDLVQPASRGAVIEAWEQVKAGGAAHRSVVLASGTNSSASMQFFDVRAAHGVFVGVLIGSDGVVDDLAEVAEIVAGPPRLVRTRKNEVAVIVDADADLTAMLGWDHDEFVGHRSLEFIHPDDQDKAIDTWMTVLTKPGATCRARLRHAHKDGRWVWLEIANRNALDTDGYVDCEMFDISEEMNAHEAVRASEQLLRRLAGALPVGVVQFDVERRILYANDRLREILGADASADEDTMLAAVVDVDDLESAIARVLAGEDVDVDTRIDRLDGTGRRLCSIALRALVSPEGEVTGAVASVTDVTDAARMRAELEQRATFDDLTGCVNRATAINHLEHELARAQQGTTVIFVDLDDFKSVNDQYGHAVGDMLLVAVAARLRDAVRAGDVVGRLGGDEFLVVCADMPDPHAALALAERIADTVAAPLDVDLATLAPRASIGVANVGDRQLLVDAEMLIAEADGAMYASKAAASGRPVLAGAPNRPHLRSLPSTGELAAQLRQAIARDELEIHHQPIVHMVDGTLLGHEALLRWRRHDRLVPAAEFIFAAEATGLICDVGPWVIDEVSREAVARRRPDLKWFVNLSPRELAAPRTIASFGNALDRHGVAPSSIVVEITEHAALVDGGVASSVISELARLGIAIALDDFGTGHSSVSTLLALPIDWLKIDRRFTAAVDTDRGRAVVAGMASLAAQVGATAIAEGVETEHEAATLRDLGVVVAQGFLFGSPAPLDASPLRV